ncbi:MAG: hypothetical protein IJX08_07390 [Clostridia bacterium]|nr:hypothetical protein [Clostridia bacterium]
MTAKINRYYALFSSGHLLLFVAIGILTAVVTLLSCFQGNGIEMGLEVGVFLLLGAVVFLPLAHTSHLEIDQTGALVFDRGTLLKFNFMMRHAIKDSYKITKLYGFRFEQNVIEKRLNVGRLILSGAGEAILLNGRLEQEQISDLVIYGIVDFESFKQSFVDELNKKR